MYYSIIYSYIQIDTVLNSQVQLYTEYFLFYKKSIIQYGISLQNDILFFHYFLCHIKSVQFKSCFNNSTFLCHCDGIVLMTILVQQIPEGYHIHHIDGDRTNNAINNLIAVSQKMHYLIHYVQYLRYGINKDLLACNRLGAGLDDVHIFPSKPRRSSSSYAPTLINIIPRLF